MSPATADAEARSDAGVLGLACAGCGAIVPPTVSLPTRCPAAVAGDDIDHVLTRHLAPASVRLDDDPEPFVRFRRLFRAYHLARRAGWSDGRYVDLVRGLDLSVAWVDGHGFHETPFARAAELSDHLGFTGGGGVWVKDETGAVAGSHKARHLMGIMISLLVAEEIDPSATAGRPLAIASCGNAALAAAVVARAASRPLDVFVPPEADPGIVTRLGELGARVEIVPRVPGETGDPTVRRLREALGAGAIPFTCQGPENGLTIEGGETIAWEIAASMARDGLSLDRLVVQVGGGALASSCARGLAEARQLGTIATVPRIDTVQTEGAWPLRRAWERVRSRLAERGLDTTARLDPADPVLVEVLADAARHRSRYMWPWETEPRSVAHGIIDDETYDWLAVVGAMLETGGRPVVVGEDRLRSANALARDTTSTDADETGTAGLAGLSDLIASGDVRPDERVALLFTGIRRGGPAFDRSTS
ncbi:MAG TPA: pyridoxal-phosphate dependent enzyme [Candidatus Limnocylindrales bacterium]